jgi:hypothetical protein
VIEIDPARPHRAGGPVWAGAGAATADAAAIRCATGSATMTAPSAPPPASGSSTRAGHDGHGPGGQRNDDGPAAHAPESGPVGGVAMRATGLTGLAPERDEVLGGLGGSATMTTPRLTRRGTVRAPRRSEVVERPGGSATMTTPRLMGWGTSRAARRGEVLGSLGGSATMTTPRLTRRGTGWGRSWAARRVQAVGAPGGLGVVPVRGRRGGPGVVALGSGVAVAYRLGGGDPDIGPGLRDWRAGPAMPGRLAVRPRGGPGAASCLGARGRAEETR